jgi:glyoxylase-like metal-dependent hydrolase (beta-lactamase superfamily II)
MGQLSAAIIPVTAFQQNCTLLFDSESKKGAVIDPGGDIDRIEAAIKEADVEIEAIYLTHGHIDHAAGAEDLKAKLNVKIIGSHKADEPLLQGLEDQAKMFGLEDDVKNVTPDQWLDDGDKVTIGGHEFDVFFRPGHAPGHVVYYNAAHKFAHLGDVLFQGSVGRTDLPGSNHQALMDSIKNKILTLPDDVSFICGHGAGSTIGAERRSNPFLKGL